MPEYIHSRQTPEGTHFRTWSTVIDAYTSAEMDEEQLKLLLLYRTLEREFRFVLLDRIERAKSQGTSEIGSYRSSEGDWDQDEITPYEGFEEEIQEYARGTGRLKVVLESLLSNWKEVSEGFYNE